MSGDSVRACGGFKLTHRRICEDPILPQLTKLVKQNKIAVEKEKNNGGRDLFRPE